MKSIRFIGVNCARNVSGDVDADNNADDLVAVVVHVHERVVEEEVHVACFLLNCTIVLLKFIFAGWFNKMITTTYNLQPTTYNLQPTLPGTCATN